MQPHRYSRLNDLYEEFCRCFNDADHVIVADIYEAGEKPIEGVSKQYLVDGLRTHGHRSAHVLPSKEDLPRMLGDLVQKGDYVIFMGAGNITHWAYAAPDQLSEELAKRKGSAA